MAPEPAIGVTLGDSVCIEDLPAWIDPLEALERLRGRRHPVLLLSGLDGHPASRYSILSADPLMMIRLRGRTATLSWEPGMGRTPERLRCEDPFDLLRRLVPVGAGWNAAGVPFAGGAIGYLGYGLRRAVERLTAPLADPFGIPDACLGLYDTAAVFDHAEQRVRIVTAGLSSGGDSTGAGAVRRAGRMRRLFRELATTSVSPHSHVPFASRVARMRTSKREYLDRVTRALAYIAQGDIYQVNLSHRIECPFGDDPISLFRRLADRNPAPFAAYFDAGPFQVVSASPERFLSLGGNVARSSPIKGTRRRGRDAPEDERLRADLLESPKERAENVMITDLVRNDLGRVCVPGSVRVERLCELESFATVHHLVSTIIGRLHPDRDRVDLLRALFPGGSMTGAPKVRAMEVIDELEGEERGIYSGGIGYLSNHGRLDFNIVIRTSLCINGKAQLQVGGAIVADSNPESEYRETLDKARALLDVLRAEVRTPASG